MLPKQISISHLKKIRPKKQIGKPPNFLINFFFLIKGQIKAQQALVSSSSKKLAEKPQRQYIYFPNSIYHFNRATSETQRAAGLLPSIA